MKILKIVERLIFLGGIACLFLKLWVIGLLLIFLGTLINAFPHGPQRLLKTLAGDFLIGATFAWLLDWRLSILLIIFSAITAKFLVHGNAVNREYYASQDEKSER